MWVCVLVRIPGQVQTVSRSSCNLVGIRGAVVEIAKVPGVYRYLDRERRQGARVSRLDRAINSHCHVQKVRKGAARVALHSEAGIFCAFRVQQREHNCFLPGSFPRESFPFRATQCYTESWKICGKSEMQQTCRNQRTGHPIEPSWDQVAVLSPMSSLPPEGTPHPRLTYLSAWTPVRSGREDQSWDVLRGELGRVLSSGGKFWLGEVLLSVQPFNLSPPPSSPDWVYPVRGHHGGTHRWYFQNPRFGP